MRIEIGKKTQIIIVLLLFVGVASAISEYGNNVIIPGYFSGDGGNITGLNASNITTGTLSDARLSSSASNFNESYSYLIYTDGTTVYAMNGSTKDVNYSGSELSVVANNVYSILNDGSTWKRKIVFKGNYTLSASLNSTNYIINDFQEARLNAGGGFPILNLTNVSNNDINGGTWIGNVGYGLKSNAIQLNSSNIINIFEGNYSGFSGVTLYSIETPNNLNIYRNKISAPIRHAIDLYNSTNVSIYQNKIYGEDTFSVGSELIDINYGSTDLKIYQNKMWYNQIGDEEAIDTSAVTINKRLEISDNEIYCTGLKNSAVSGIRTGTDGIYTNNNIYDCYYGIMISSKNNTVVTNNNIYNTTRGIYLQDGFNNTIRNNNIYRATVGIWIRNNTKIPKDNIIMNNFIFNTTTPLTINLSHLNIASNNYGASPFDFGAMAMTASDRIMAFGANDRVINSSRLPPHNICVSTAAGDAWINATSAGVC